MEILVTGPDGVLGSNLVRELLRRNYGVSVLVETGKNPITLAGLPITTYEGNILDPQLLDKAFVGKDIVFHCAASTIVFPAQNPMVRKINIEGTLNVINASLKHSIKRFIYVGTANSFGSGNTLSNLGNENSSFTAGKYHLDYIDSKYDAQLLVLEAVKNKNLPAIIVNPTFMIGPFDSRPSSGAMIIAIAKKKVPGFSSGGKNFVAVKDVATAMANAITMGRIGECYILGNENISIKEAFVKIAKVVGVDAPRIKMPDRITISYGMISSFLATVLRFKPSVTKELAVISCENHFHSSSKAVKELQLPQTPIEEAIKECYEWFTKNGYL
ncbi:MAG: NAD-dependent epimerase/dehydratase family protein [Bacteroidetes bacterium]|nr:NAD-dependent epimerase/dehydratase family protein [Bacteroidota bacterium]